MNFQEYVDLINAPCAILRVERTGEGFCGEVTILCANDLYKDAMGPGYRDGMPYWELVPKDVKFEDFCFRSAILGKKIHAYVETKAFNCWVDEQLVPLVSHEENVGYCQFTFEMTVSVIPERMAAVNMDTAEAVIKTCVTLLSGEDFRDNVKTVLSDLLANANAFCCRVVLIDRKLKTCETFCNVLKEPVDDDGVIPYAVARTWDDVIGMSNAIIIQNEHDMREMDKINPIWAASLRAYRVESLILVPLRHGTDNFGYLYMANFDVERIIEIKELTELVSYFLSTELANYLLLKRLESMSSTDPLTGLNNRHAMEERFQTMRRQPFGVVSIDLNGLKAVNDNEGHAAGDRLLARAAETFTSIFRRDDVFRIGGDEFLIIATGIPHDVFDDKIQRLHVAQSPNLSFAMGAYWSDGRDRVNEVIHRTDEMMYDDKREYYRRNPNKKREPRKG